MRSLIDRRTMLRQAAAASLILGFPLLASGGDRAANAVENDARAAAQQPAGPVKGVPVVHRTPAAVAPLAPGDVAKRTLERMKGEKKPGLVLLYPADVKSQPAVTAGLTAMLASERLRRPLDLRRLGARVPAGAGGGSLRRRTSRVNVLLIDADGRAVDGALRGLYA